jgi:large subunit ribosomal protein L18
MALTNRKAIRARIHKRIRRKLSGTAERPRLAVYFSNTNVYAQIIDDEAGKTIVSASTKEKGLRRRQGQRRDTQPKWVLSSRSAPSPKNISEVVFDRAGFIYPRQGQGPR